MSSPLLHFNIAPSADGFELRLETEDGDVVETIATEEQLDVISEEIDRLLNEETIDEEDLVEDDASDTENE